ncbi:HAD-IIIA family hydrolase [Butyrivibrio fibrisolvens]|uniref:HAD-IIIA family hydrolase n=1 Tax=Butyrivibrio fibrisolvens TaxID=831 RepID=UPI000410395E|nr:HAD-IIIA family hydrolase [Butyrivibrio fibrisolvens]
MKVIIMAGGKGTRISSLFPNIPKPLIPIEDSNGVSRAVLEWEIISLAEQGFNDITLTLSHMYEQIEDYFGDGAKWGVKISYYIEDIPLGNCGALFKMSLDEDFLLLNADSMFDVDFKRMVEYHRAKGGLATIFTHPNSHPYDSGLVLAEEDGSVGSWLSKEDIRPRWYKNRVNAGIHILSPNALKMSGIAADSVGTTDENGKVIKVDLDRQVLKPLCGTGKLFCYDSPEYCKDMGTPERFEQVSSDFKSGLVHARNLKNKQKAIFLDRDGTINKYVGFLRKTDEFELLDGAAEAIKLINDSGYLAIVITNQPVIARGEVTVPELAEIHNKMETLLGQQGAYIDGLYYCPHHPDRGFEGEIPDLKIVCNCRKPKPGMIIKAAEDFNIDLRKSWMIGDGENDIRAGMAAGCKTVKIGEACGSDVNTDSLFEAIRIILTNS